MLKSRTKESYVDSLVCRRSFLELCFLWCSKPSAFAVVFRMLDGFWGWCSAHGRASTRTPHASMPADLRRHDGTLGAPPQHAERVGHARFAVRDGVAGLVPCLRDRAVGVPTSRERVPVGYYNGALSPEVFTLLEWRETPAVLICVGPTPPSIPVRRLLPPLDRPRTLRSDSGTRRLPATRRSPLSSPPHTCLGARAMAFEPGCDN